MISRITPNLTSPSQSKNNNKVTFAANLVLGKLEGHPNAGKYAMASAGLSEDAFGRLVEYAKRICGDDTFTLKQTVIEKLGLVAAITHAPAKTTKGLFEATDIFYGNNTGEDAIKTWLQHRHDAWLMHNKA